MGTAAAALDLIVALLGNAQKIGAILQTVQAEGRTTLTPEEWAAVTGADDSAEAQVLAAIQAAKAAGR
jgi:hypothetical protein